MKLNNKAMTGEGIGALIQEGKRRFRTEENLNFYSSKDFKTAEKLFIKKCILQGRCRSRLLGIDS